MHNFPFLTLLKTTVTKTVTASFRVLGASFSILGASFSSFGCLSRFELHSIRYRILVIALDFCCIYIGLVFIKDRPVSSFLGASFSR